MPAPASTAPAIVIAGAGECGTRAAFTLREQGWDGRIVLVGDEPHCERSWPRAAGSRSSAAGSSGSSWPPAPRRWAPG
jgi:glycine/D-amino acid oxidase-like deaminating enzyme